MPLLVSCSVMPPGSGGSILFFTSWASHLLVAIVEPCGRQEGRPRTPFGFYHLIECTKKARAQKFCVDKNVCAWPLCQGGGGVVRLLPHIAPCITASSSCRRAVTASPHDAQCRQQQQQQQPSIAIRTGIGRPDEERLIGRGAYKPLALARCARALGLHARAGVPESNGAHGRLVPPQTPFLLAGLDVPYKDGLVMGSRRQQPAVVREGHRVDRPRVAT